jgi:hypothetical protein
MEVLVELEINRRGSSAFACKVHVQTIVREN